MEGLQRQRLARTIRELRLAKGLRQGDLAVPGAVSRSSISALERGALANPSRALLTAIARGLGVPYEALLGLTDAESVILDLLEEGRSLAATFPTRSVKAGQRALILARRLRLPDAEQAAAEGLAEWYGQLGDEFQAGVYAAWALLRVDWSAPAYQTAILRLGSHLHELGEWRMEITLYRHFLLGFPPSNPQAARIFLRLGSAYLEVGRYPLAVRVLSRARRDGVQLGRAEVTAAAWVALAQALAFGNRHGEAARALAQAADLVRTYALTDIATTVLRSQDVLAVLSSPSLLEAHRKWQEADSILIDHGNPLRAQVTLLRAWIVYAYRHAAWADVLEAAQNGLQMVRAMGAPSSRGLKGWFLWARSEAELRSGHAPSPDREWAEDLLRRNPRTLLGGYRGIEPPTQAPTPGSQIS